MTTIRIGTRRSKLALWQANHISSLLAKADPALKISLVPIETSGDRLKKISSPDVSVKGLFVKEIESALMAKKIDLAVHSMKDLPMDLPKGLVIAAIPPREDPRDVLVSRGAIPFGKLSGGARVGTSSLRRVNQLKKIRSDLCYEQIRGNVDTRVKRLKEGKYDAVVLAAAGLKRLGLESEITEFLEIIPAAGQGAIGIEIRAGDTDLKKRLKPLDDRTTRISVDAERIFLTIMQGGCRLPVACHVKPDGLRSHGPVSPEESSFLIEAFISDLEGARFLSDRLTVDDLESLANGARRLAEKLLSLGAREIIESIRGLKA